MFKCEDDYYFYYYNYFFFVPFQSVSKLLFGHYIQSYSYSSASTF